MVGLHFRLLLCLLLFSPNAAASAPADSKKLERLREQARSEQNPATARKLLEQALELARRTHAAAERTLLNDAAELTGRTGDYAAAQTYLNQSVRLAAAAHDTLELGRAYFYSAIVAMGREQPDRRVRFLEQAVTMFERLPPPSAWLLKARSQLATCYLELHRPVEAKRAFRQAWALSKQVGDPAKEFGMLIDWAATLVDSEPDSARPLLTYAQHLADDVLHQPYPRAYVRVAQSHLAKQQRAWPALVQFSGEAAALARQAHQTGIEAVALTDLALGLRQSGRFQLAFDTMQRAYQLRDTLTAQTQRGELNRLQVVFDVEAKEARIRALEQQRRIAALTADRQRARNQLLIGGVLALLALLAVGSWFFVRQRRSQAALVASEAEAQAAADAARAAEAKAKAANATKDQIMSVIGHDLRGPVASFQQLTPVLRQLVPAGPGTAEAQRLLDSLAAGARHLGELLDNLLRWARTEDGQTPNYPTHLPAADVASAATELLQPLALSKQIGLRLHVAPPHLFVFADPDLLATVLRNLVANAIKFTPVGGQVTVSIDTTSTGGVRLTVADTGIGIAPERIRNLLEIAGRDSTRGTTGELGTGLGLPLSARFVRLMGGELRLTSQPGQGTEAAFELPAPPPRFGT